MNRGWALAGWLDVQRSRSVLRLYLLQLIRQKQSRSWMDVHLVLGVGGERCK